MKKTRFTEPQFVKAIQEQENGRKTEDYSLRPIQPVFWVFS
jgi:hypothetical protein